MFPKENIIFYIKLTAWNLGQSDLHISIACNIQMKPCASTMWNNIWKIVALKRVWWLTEGGFEEQNRRNWFLYFKKVWGWSRYLGFKVFTLLLYCDSNIDKYDKWPLKSGLTVLKLK